MNKKILIFGTTMFSAEMAELLRWGGIEVVGFVVDSKFKESNEFLNLPVFEFEKIENLVDIKNTEFALTLGYSAMNEYRKTKYEICKAKNYKVFTYVSPMAQVFSKKIGDGSLILPGTYIGPFSEIGICTVIRPGTVLAHHDIIKDYNWIADGCTFGGGVKVGNNCFFGLGTTVRNEINVANYTFSGAQSFIGQDTAFMKAYIGVPAKEIHGKTSYEVVSKV